MSKKVLKFKEYGNESYYEFIRRISADAEIKKRFDKAIFLNYAMMNKEVSSKKVYQALKKIFPDGQIDNDFNLFMTKYDFYTKTFDETKLNKSWYIKPRYFEWVIELLEDTDYVFFPDKNNPGQFIKEEEFKFLTYKLTEVLVKRHGYNTITRSFFLNKENSVYQSYYKATKRKITKGKLAYMVSVLTERDIIYCYRRPNKPNLFVVGKKNPYFQLKDVVTNEDISNIYTKYKIDTTEHFKRQTLGKNLIHGKKEKEFRKQRSEAIREKAKEEDIRREKDKQEKDRLLAFNERRKNINIEKVDGEDDYQEECGAIIAEWKSRKAV